MPSQIHAVLYAQQSAQAVNSVKPYPQGAPVRGPIVGPNIGLSGAPIAPPFFAFRRPPLGPTYGSVGPPCRGGALGRVFFFSEAFQTQKAYT